MKIIGVDNFDNEAVADVLVAENIKNEEFANVMAAALNEKFCKDDFAPRHYKAVADDRKLRRGMEDLV